MAEHALAGVGGLFARQHTHERRLADAVGTDERDAVAALDMQAEVCEHHHVAVRLPGVCQLQHHPAALAAPREVEVDLLPLGGHFDRHHLLQQLDAALHLGRLRGLIAEPVDEHLDAADLLVLLVLGLPQGFDALVVLEQVAAVVRVVVRQRAERQVSDAGDDGVEKEPVVRDEDDRVRVGVEVGFEPVARLEVEVIGRLVEEQQTRLAQQQLREGDAHLPAPGKRLGRAVEVRRPEAQALQHRRRLELDAVPVVHAEAILQVAVPVEHAVVFRLGNRRIAEARFERVHLGLHREQRAERARSLVEHAAAGVVQPVLRQIADGERGRREDGSRVGLVEARHHLEQRRLAGPVRSAQADPFLVGDLPRDAIEQYAVAERLGEA